MILKDGVDSILKREVVHLTAQMCRFRNNISRKLLTDEGTCITVDSPIDMVKVPEGFEEAVLCDLKLVQ